MGARGEWGRRAVTELRLSVCAWRGRGLVWALMWLRKGLELGLAGDIQRTAC